MNDTLKERLSKKNILHFEGIDFLVENANVVAYIEGLKIFPLKQSHIELLKTNSIDIDKTIHEFD